MAVSTVTVKLPVQIRTHATDYEGPATTRRLWNWSVELFGREVASSMGRVVVSEQAAIRAAKREIREWAKDSCARSE